MRPDDGAAIDAIEKYINGDAAELPDADEELAKLDLSLIHSFAACRVYVDLGRILGSQTDRAGDGVDIDLICEYCLGQSLLRTSGQNR